MVGRRRYQLLCPVARALDVVGDRWSLLILRDLHAGPARFQQLQEGLGMATNLLTTRLGELVEAGLVRRLGPGRLDPYGLTELGRSTDRMLWELVRFGSRVDRDPDPRQPGNLRTVALPLRMMLSAVADRPAMVVRLLVDDEVFTIDLSADPVDVVIGEGEAEPDLIVQTDYEGFLDLAEGRIGLERFVSRHRQVLHGDDRVDEFAAVMRAGLDAAADGRV